MKQLVILSGKGGTGKTSVAAAFAHLAAEGGPPLRAVLADADVDAANLELVLSPQPLETHEFIGGPVAVIDPELCQGCGRCYDVCRFDAVLPPTDGRAAYAVDPIPCEGCAACVYQCPEEAIHMAPQLAGHWYRSDSRYGPLFHAALRPAQENSGKLVTLVKQQARLLALDGGYDAVLVDGPPGIGCPVISAASGADLALIVAEPTAAGIHDMERVLATTAHFRVPALVCINKADIYPAGTVQIEAYCLANDIQVVGQVPFDLSVTEALVHGEPVTAYRPDSQAGRALNAIWQRVAARLAGGLG
ncbi:MAG: ATP-binding protein [Chloroflexi bacterium]|nr:ATP-binding protein [Chloroflexota bacterium]